MTKEVLDFTIEKTKELMNANSCYAGLKAAAQAWLDAVGTENEAEETKKYIAELEADLMPIDGLIGFAESEMGVSVFGNADSAKMIAKGAKMNKEAGVKYCYCAACSAVSDILEKKADILS